MTETDLVAWLAIADAAQHIGCSTRTIERLARAGKLEQRLRPQAGSPAVAVYNPDDVARIAAERRPGPAAFVLPAGSTGVNGPARALSNNRPQDGANSLAAVPAGDDPIRQLAVALLAAMSPPSPPLAVTVAETVLSLSSEERAAQYIPLPEAAAIKGLTVTWLKRQIAAGTLKAKKDRGWKVRRGDLEPLR